MSKENSIFETTVATPNPERPSNVDYNEYLDGVRESEVVDGSTKESIKSTKTNAEDDVVAILLSAMMGSIVKKLKKKSLSPSECGSACPLVSKTSSVISENPEVVFSQRGEDEQQFEISYRGKLLNNTQTSVSIPSIDDGFPEKEREEREVSFNRNKLGESTILVAENQIIDTDEEGKSTQLKRIKELLIENVVSVNGWAFLEPNQEYIITFKRGNIYQGKLLNCRMHGKGTFRWVDGSVYEGDFSLGKMSGQGKLHWPDGSWYEGEFSEGYRHGRGLYVRAPTFYAGHWKCGRRHGVGAMFYNHFDTSKHYYNGEWFDDKKHGTGLRSYPSGAMYSGEWKSGHRQGLGTMVWTNGDVYSGNFLRGYMHGYGEYTWETFINKQLLVPEENCYYGEWVRNVRHGCGTLETSSGVVVKGSWKNGKKHGPAEVVCSNGQSLYAENLFYEDNTRLSENSFDADSLMDTGSQSLLPLPVNAPCHEINVGCYVKRLIEYIQECSSLGKSFCLSSTENPVETCTNRTFSFYRNAKTEESKFDFTEEENHVRNIIRHYLSSLKNIYRRYALICGDAKPSFPVILIRLMWWQLLRDCNLHSRGRSLAYFDICIARNKASLVQGVHYPFERLLFWQFLHCLIEVSWELYGSKCIGSPSVKGIIASALHKLITVDLIPNSGRHKGHALTRCRDLLSLDSVYKYYRRLGEPHSAREFLKNVAVSEKNCVDHVNVPDYLEYQIKGRNIIGLGEKLTYLPKEEPLLSDCKFQVDPSHPKNLTCLNSIGLPSVFECIIQICPSISSGELIVNMDYKIVFLEFYELLILCASKVAKDKISKRKPNEEEEKIAETALLQNNSKEISLALAEELLSSPGKTNERKSSSATKKSKKKKK